MIDNTLTLAVDTANDGNPTNRVYTRFDTSNPNRTIYIGPDHRADRKDTLALYRSFPTKSGSFKGVLKSAVKITDEQTVLGALGENLTAPCILDINFAIPVGVSSDFVKEMRQRAIAMLDNDTIMDRASIVQEI